MLPQRHRIAVNVPGDAMTVRMTLNPKSLDTSVASWRQQIPHERSGAASGTQQAHARGLADSDR